MSCVRQQGPLLLDGVVACLFHTGTAVSHAWLLRVQEGTTWPNIRGTQLHTQRHSRRNRQRIRHATQTRQREVARRVVPGFLSAFFALFADAPLAAALLLVLAPLVAAAVLALAGSAGAWAGAAAAAAAASALGVASPSTGCATSAAAAAAGASVLDTLAAVVASAAPHSRSQAAWIWAICMRAFLAVCPPVHQQLQCIHWYHPERHTDSAQRRPHIRQGPETDCCNHSDLNASRIAPVDAAG